MHVAAVAGLLLLLAACGRDPTQSALDGYLADLRAVLGTPPEGLVATLPAVPGYPKRRRLRLASPDLMVGLIEFLDITRRCGLGPLVAERNSAMGKLMPDSRRLVYEQTLHGRLATCLAGPSAGQEPYPEPFESRLRGIVERKRAELPGVFWNATFAGPEMAALFSVSGGGPLVVPGDGALDRVLGAIAYLRQMHDWLGDPDRRFYSAGVEANLAVLREAYGSRLLATLSRLTVSLDTAAAGLEADVAAGCDAATSLMQVRRRHWDGWLSSYLDAVSADGQRFLDALRDLALAPRDPMAPEGRLADMSAFEPFFRQVLERRDPGSLWVRFQIARDRHRLAWNSVVERARTGCE